ncbi:MAG: hypothetical protein ACJ766_17525 [Thermoleophilaceae bacterium]
MRAVVLVSVATLALAGCAAERASAPSLLIPADSPLKTQSFKRSGLTISLPRQVAVRTRKAPEVFRAPSADWYVAGFAYKRAEQLPRSTSDLRAARRRLLAEARRRDPHFKVLSSKLTKSRGSPAIQIVGDQVLDQRRLRTRSLHVYKGKGEYVLEMAAPPAEFPTLDGGLFDRIAASLRVTGKPA